MQPCNLLIERKNNQLHRNDQHEGRPLTTSAESHALSSSSWLRRLFPREELSRRFVKFLFACRIIHALCHFSSELLQFFLTMRSKFFQIFDRIAGGLIVATRWNACRCITRYYLFTTIQKFIHPAFVLRLAIQLTKNRYVKRMAKFPIQMA